MKKGSAGDDILGNPDETADNGDDESKSMDDQDNTDDEMDVLEDNSDPELESDPVPTSLGPLSDDSNHAIVGEPPQDSGDGSSVPWVYTRANVKQDREMVQFYLRDFIQQSEDDLVDAVSEELGTEISKTDVREAAYVAAMRDVDAVVEELMSWGFEPTE